jgi:hypothetical protein
MAATREELLELPRNDKRAVIYANILNAVPVWVIKQHFEMSEEDVMRLFRFVSSKLKSYIFERKLPPILCDSISDAQRNKILLLQLLPKLNLDKPPAKKVNIEHIDQRDLEGAFRGINR